MVVSRAFASLSDFVQLTRFHVKQSGKALAGVTPSSLLKEEKGYWLAMKGQRPEAELNALAGELGVEIEDIVVPGLDAQRCVVWMWV